MNKVAIKTPDITQQEPYVHIQGNDRQIQLADNAVATLIFAHSSLGIAADMDYLQCTKFNECN
ncbi:hypothetical protein AADZ86_02205 [Colwelliaceae bacterium BS250]